MTTLQSLRIRHFPAVFMALLAAGSSVAQTPVKPTVSGKFTGNGKNAAIQYVTVEDREPFSDKEAITLIFTEKDPAKAKKPGFDASFGKLGNALILQVNYEGGIFGCEVSHSAHEKRGFSSIGSIKMEEFKIEGGNVTGRASTGQEVDAFGEKWEVDLTFAAPMPAKKESKAAAKPTPSEPAEPAEEEPKAAAGPAIAAKSLPLPKDATNVDFKAIVKHIQFSCPRSVEPVAKEFAAELKKQGWKDLPGSLITKQNATFRRELGDANLTVMIQPAGSGCTVKIFTEGLVWD